MFFFCISDLHALTVFPNQIQESLNNRILDTLALFLSCGVDPNKSTVFLQSHVLEHTQLYWILSNFSYFGELSRMTQFKYKVNLNKNIPINLSLFSYPVLMAADILLYQTNFVPVGLDQKQHLELVQSIAHRFNKKYGDIFTIPSIILNNIGYKIMALQNPIKKMSKSDINLNNSIFLLDDIKLIRMKLQKALTDSNNPPQVIYDKDNKPGISNLLMILSSLTGKKISKLELEFERYTYQNFKKYLLDILIEVILKIQKSYFIFRKDIYYLHEILKNGAENARKYSKKTLYIVQNILNS
ncbi:tryptophanyl-tRNA synthetase [Buchnera aphidicola (Cinara tujafilina)]|uniref:Tryptophan--tRNA ligase n=1 Tax=Buchnera aphidicola (Cinara tujafilina) TaxID=261317 RepID=F7WZQ0_9GAMM|nr:tryptophanyl-tRNA synthetase [Buchnera aphidicola (Cinara tujafilina)]